MLSNIFFIIILSTTIAAIPAAIWAYLFLKETSISKFHLIMLFIIGILTAPTLLGIQYLWQIYPTFNLGMLIETKIEQINIMYATLFILFGAMEEIIKHLAVRIIDKRTLAITTINNALRLSILAALGFSFAENIYYLYQLWGSLSVGEMTGVFIFRSGFTTCAHMIFSGIFGYYFGISKFAIDITKQQRVSGKTDLSTRIIAKLFATPIPHAHREKTILKGLLIAVLMHATYNFLLQFNVMIPVMLFVVLGYLFLRYLLNKKTGHLVLLTDVSVKKKSMLAKKDEDIIIELIGTWFEDKKYADVAYVCGRLLERDPDNNVVKLFKEKALDKIQDRNMYKKISNKISPEDKSIITKYL